MGHVLANLFAPPENKTKMKVNNDTMALAQDRSQFHGAAFIGGVADVIGRSSKLPARLPARLRGRPWATSSMAQVKFLRMPAMRPRRSGAGSPATEFDR